MGARFAALAAVAEGATLTAIALTHLPPAPFGLDDLLPLRTPHEAQQWPLPGGSQALAPGVACALAGTVKFYGPRDRTERLEIGAVALYAVGDPPLLVAAEALPGGCFTYLPGSWVWATLALTAVNSEG